MSKKYWLSLIIIGLAGQIAWTVENMYFNVFMYNTITTDRGWIAAMVSSSAVVATVTTVIMGALSDRKGNRRLFIAVGYIIWSFTVLAFAFVNAGRNSALFVVVLDCIMTFFGSTANDAAFNAYITESTDNTRRTKVEAVVQVLPMAAMLFVFGVMDSFTQNGDWPLFFALTAAIMFIAGILSFFLLERNENTVKKEDSFIDDLTFGFKKETIKSNKELYTALTAYAVNSLSMQVFFPYLIIYIQMYLGFTSSYVILLAVTIVTASIMCILGGKAASKRGEVNTALVSVPVMAIGLIMMYAARSFVFTTISGIVMMTGYLVSVSMLSALTRVYTPKGREGGVQGVRMIFQVMLPMVLGPYIGAAAIKSSNITYVELGVTKTVPAPLIFLIAAAVDLMTLIPVALLKRKERAQ